jgi:hypothetical protein
MATGHHETQTHAGQFEPSKALQNTAYAMVGIGALGFIIGLVRNQEAVWPAYLTAYFYVSCLGLGGLFWAAINNVTKAGWSVGLRRVAEGFTSFIPVMVVGSLVLLAGVKHLYPWANPEEVAQNAVIQAKTGYLNIGALVIRLLIFGGGMWFFAKKIVGNSIQQDKNGDEKLTHKNVGWSIGFLLFFALSFSLFSVDLLMTLLPTWYSTIFGIYCFAGLFQSSLALLILVLIYLNKKGFITGYYTEEHIHDLGKYLKGFTVFWAYIAFSQFMLIWYANIPEETEYYLMRSQHGWMMISIAILVFKFIVPFLLLLPKSAKRNWTTLPLVCLLVLVINYVDDLWMVGPNFNENVFRFGFYEASLLIGFLGLLLMTTMRFYKKNGLVALKDPRMHEALNHHVTY